MNMNKVKSLIHQYSDSFLFEYIYKCRTREIIIGKDLMAMLDILIDDMDNPLFRFNLSEAHKRIGFIENECKHSISPWAGQPFLLELHQKALREAIYGFYMKIEDNWWRRFNEVIYLVGRKNGKTTEISGDANAEFFCGNRGTNIISASNDYAQAGLVYEEINNMREENTKLARVSRKNQSGIFMGGRKQKKKKGKFSKQNKAQIKKLSARSGAKEGRNIDFAAIDEVHEMKDNSLIAPIVQSTSTKDESLIFEITTEGFTEDGYLDKRLIDARKLLKGEIYRPRWLVWLYTQDNEEEIWQDRSSWVKSNPNLGVTKKWHYLDGLIEEAKTNSATRAFMLAKDFNIKQSNAQAWLQVSEIINLETFDLKDFAGSFYISGSDFAESVDLCASTILLKRANDPKTYLHTRYWIPESKLTDSPDDVDYQKWEREGYLTIVKGNAVDSATIADWHFELLKEYDLKPFKSGYDNQYAKDFQNRYIDIFGDKITINIPQQAKVLNNPMRTLEADMRDNLVNYDNNPVCKWCFGNTGLKVDTLGRIMPAKMETTKRIDGVASKVIAYAVLEWFKAGYMELIG